MHKPDRRERKASHFTLKTPHRRNLLGNLNNPRKIDPMAVLFFIALQKDDLGQSFNNITNNPKNSPILKQK